MKFLNFSIAISTTAALLLPLKAQAFPFFRNFWPGRSDDADLGRPISRRGGGGRTENSGGATANNPCLRSLIALEPGDAAITTQSTVDGDICPTSYVDVALTAEAQPFIWVYFPEYSEYPELGLPVEIVILDNLRPIEKWEIALPDVSGIMCFQLPYELETNNVYGWSLETKLTPSSAANPTVGGLLEYRPAATDTWKDRLTTAGKQLIADSTAAQQSEWQSLLQDQGLETIAAFLPSRDCLNLEIAPE